jgi:branched-chain amino acid transport system permease protein
MSLFIDLVVQGVIHGSIYALVAVGLTMVYGLLRILHIAHAGVFTLGAYVTAIITNATGSLALALLFSVLISGAVGSLIYRLCYEPILRQPPLILLIASVGILIVMQEGFRIAFGAEGFSYVRPQLEQRASLLGISLSYAEIAIIVLAFSVFLGIGLFAKFTRFGLACRATVTDPKMATSFGISLAQVRYFTFFVGSAFAALAGSMVGIADNVIEPSMGNVPSYKSLAVIVLGGFGDVRGTLVAAISLGILESFGTIYLGSILDRDAIAFVAMFAILMVRPHGLFGGR